MSVRVIRKVVCDRCGADGGYRDGEEIEDRRKYLRGVGWRCMLTGQSEGDPSRLVWSDLCRECQAPRTSVKIGGRAGVMLGYDDRQIRECVRGVEIMPYRRGFILVGNASALGRIAKELEQRADQRHGWDYMAAERRALRDAAKRVRLAVEQHLNNTIPKEDR